MRAGSSYGSSGSSGSSRSDGSSRSRLVRASVLALALALAFIAGSCTGEMGVGVGYSSPGGGYGQPWVGGYRGGPITY
jgi:hypothetical protein